MGYIIGAIILALLIIIYSACYVSGEISEAEKEAERR